MSNTALTGATAFVVPPHTPVIAVLRASTADYFLDAARALYDGGIRSIEVTLTTPGALNALSQLHSEFGEDTFLGVGSITGVDDANRAIDAGAQYLVTASLRSDVIDLARARSVPVVPGALTPTEISTGWAAGATAVKVFPAGSVGGPAYISAVRGPMAAIPLVPSGGVQIEDISAYLSAGAAAVGLGGPLIGDGLDAEGDRKALKERAARATDAARAAYARRTQ